MAPRTRSSEDEAGTVSPAMTTAKNQLLRQQLRDMAAQLQIITERLYSLTEDASVTERALPGGRGGPRRSHYVEDHFAEDDATEDDPEEDDATEDDPEEDDATDDDPVEDDATEDDPAEDDPSEGDPIGDEPDETNPTNVNRVGLGDRVRYAVRHWPRGCGRSPRSFWAEDAQSRCG